MRFVLDACVALKWLVPETDSEKARELLSAWEAGSVELVAPDLLLAEVASALWRKAVRKEMQEGHAASLFSGFLRLNLPLVPIEELVIRALDLAFLCRHPVYDCTYVALAVRERSLLVRADERLFIKLSTPLPGMVRLLREWNN